MENFAWISNEISGCCEAVHETPKYSNIHKILSKYVCTGKIKKKTDRSYWNIAFSTISIKYHSNILESCEITRIDAGY